VKIGEPLKIIEIWNTYCKRFSFSKINCCPRRKAELY
jgi:hypothetical protein